MAVAGWWVEFFALPTGIATVEAFGGPRVGAAVYPASVDSGEVFGAAALTYPQDITAEAIASLEDFGATTVTPAAVSITPTGIDSVEAFGTAAITVGAVTITCTGIGSAEAFGTATTVQPQVLDPTGITSAEAFGTATVKFTLPYTVPFTI